jgi:FkbH-like protein
MKLVEALNIIKKTKQLHGELFTCFLATGLNPLHLSTFLAAELSLLFPGHNVQLQHGLYGDLLGNVNRLAKADAGAGIVLLEWADLDARLGVRSSSAWSPTVCADIVATVKFRACQLQHLIEAASQAMPVIVSFPTLPLPPASFAPGWQAGSLEVELNTITHNLRSRISQLPQVRILSPQRLDMVSPLRERFDVESELLAGFPYRLAHASALANLLAQLTRKPVPKKGLITDLDDTLWRGILGEVGVEGISWDLDHHTQMHTFYQRVLGALGAEGVLLGVASKNERALVETALGRKDLAVSTDVFFPLEVSWRRKSDAVARILRTWNIGADSVVFVDDSPLELAEVKASHPGVECIQFPTKDSAGVYDLAYRLRDLFGKSAILEEDAIRAQSIRRSRATAEAYEIGSGPGNFLAQVQAEISINFSRSPLDPRALELVNKTNQFNLNGKRFTEAAWQNYLREPESFLAIASYTDKFGPLGKIAVIVGRRNENELTVDAWVMSCRAFSRRVEHTCLQELFTKFGADTIKLDFLKTDRNGPLREFLEEILGAPPEPGCAIPRQLFEARCKMAQEPQEIANG